MSYQEATMGTPVREQTTAAQEWGMLDGLRSTMLSRCEKLAQLTVPSVMPDEFYNNLNDQLTNGFSSLGSQSATHLTNKLMMAMFQPSRPFFRLELDEETRLALMQQLQVQEDVLTDSLASGERRAMSELEQAGVRQQLFEGVLHLVVVGNVLMDLSGDSVAFTPLRDYVVRRNAKGKWITLIVREQCQFHELEDSAQREVMARKTCKWDAVVSVYTHVRWVKGMYRSTIWVDDVQLSLAHSGKYTEENCPWRVLTWRLPAKQHYGVGRAEEFANDLAMHDKQSEALSDGSALASTFKWLANPAGLTKPEDVTNSPNGAVIPGANGDLSLLSANIGQQLATVMSIQENYARRIGAGFLMNSAVTRQAERVTAEEIRIQAVELESSLGGTYSRMALEVQQPLAYWLLKKAKVEIKGTKIKPKVITGLDALSRSADRDRMMLFLGDVTTLSGIQPEQRMLLNENNIVADMAAGNGVDRQRYVASPEEVAKRQQDEQQRAINEQAATAAVGAAATNAQQEQV